MKNYHTIENQRRSIELNNMLNEFDFIELSPGECLSFKNYFTEGFHISQNKFIYLSVGTLNDNESFPLKKLNDYFRKLNAVFKNRFNLDQGFIKCKLNEGGDLNIILYAEKPNITWGDLHDYLDLLKEFINAEITIDLPKYNGNTTLADLSLSQIDLCSVDVADNCTINIIRFLDSENSSTFFILNNKFEYPVTKDFDYLYSILFIFVFVYKEYIGIYDSIKEVGPANILLVYYATREVVSDEVTRNTLDTIQLVQMLPSSGYLNNNINNNYVFRL